APAPLQMCPRSAAGAGRLLDGHAGLERSVGEIRQEGIGEPLHQTDPHVAIATLRHRLVLARAVNPRLRHRADRSGGVKELPSIHARYSLWIVVILTPIPSAKKRRGSAPAGV